MHEYPRDHHLTVTQSFSRVSSLFIDSHISRSTRGTRIPTWIPFRLTAEPSWRATDSELAKTLKASLSQTTSSWNSAINSYLPVYHFRSPGDAIASLISFLSILRRVIPNVQFSALIIQIVGCWDCRGSRRGYLNNLSHGVNMITGGSGVE
ncbi:hypothetical protein BC827DRAFT_1204475 [Russula dissimulans]|nr:hypothetical protein BC827DRAFT_1204475 [Russula dissimulans]